MKCAAAVIRSSRGFRGPSSTRNHAGIRRSRNVRTPGAISCTFVGDCQYGWITSSGVCELSTYGAPGRSRSQRRLPITIAAGPPRVTYESLFGAIAVNRVVVAFLGFDARVSSNTIDFDARTARVRRASWAVASGASAGTRIVVVDLPTCTRTSGAPDAVVV